MRGIPGNRGKRGGTRGKGQHEAVGEERAAGAEKKSFKSEKFLKTCIFSACGGLLQYPICGSDASGSHFGVLLSYKLGKS